MEIFVLTSAISSVNQNIGGKKDRGFQSQEKYLQSFKTRQSKLLFVRRRFGKNIKCNGLPLFIFAYCYMY